MATPSAPLKRTLAARLSSFAPVDVAEKAADKITSFKVARPEADFRQTASYVVNVVQPQLETTATLTPDQITIVNAEIPQYVTTTSLHPSAQEFINQTLTSEFTAAAPDLPIPASQSIAEAFMQSGASTGTFALPTQVPPPSPSASTTARARFQEELTSGLTCEGLQAVAETHPNPSAVQQIIAGSGRIDPQSLQDAYQQAYSPQTATDIHSFTGPDNSLNQFTSFLTQNPVTDWAKDQAVSYAKEWFFQTELGQSVTNIASQFVFHPGADAAPAPPEVSAGAAAAGVTTTAEVAAGTVGAVTTTAEVAAGAAGAVTTTATGVAAGAGATTVAGTGAAVAAGAVTTTATTAVAAGAATATGAAPGVAARATAGAAAGAAAGAPTGPGAIITAAIGAAIGITVGVAGSILTKIKDDILPILATLVGGLIGLATGSVGLGIAGGLTTLGVGSAISALGGSTSGTAGFVQSVATKAGAIITGATTAAVGSAFPPVVASIIAIPIVVALMLFIINAGGYVVPPSQGTFVPGAFGSFPPGIGGAFPCCWPTEGGISQGPPGTTDCSPYTCTHVPGNLNGIDIAAPLNTPVYATHNGTAIAYADTTGYGNAVTITSPAGFVTLYGHFINWTIPRGESEVLGGQQIGLVGSTGNSTGPHLHYELP